MFCLHVQDKLAFIETSLGETGGHLLLPVRMNIKDPSQDEVKIPAQLKATETLGQDWECL